jgi:Tfp pilus assembly protein PilX
MKAIRIANPDSNQDGYAMVITMLLLVLLTVIGIAATQTSNIEVAISGNNKKSVQDFYTSEGGLISALENANVWLTTGFLTAGEASAFYSGPVDFDGDGNNDATIEARCIEISGTTITGLSDGANDVPVDKHTGPPPADSGYSLVYFTVRKYGVTSTSLKNGTEVQSGVWKVFNIF